MGFKDSFEQPQSEKEGKPLIEINKRMGEFDISIEIERGEEPISAKIDLVNKTIEAKITPEGVVSGFETVKKFLEDPTKTEKLKSLNDKWEAWLERKKEERKKTEATGTIRDYAKQTGKEEGEVVKEVLNILQTEEKDHL